MNLNCEDINELIKNFLFLEHETKIKQNEIDRLNTIIDCQQREIETLRERLKGNNESK